MQASDVFTTRIVTPLARASRRSSVNWRTVRPVVSTATKSTGLAPRRFWYSSTIAVLMRFAMASDALHEEARAHRRRERDALDVDALRRDRLLRLDEGEDRLDVGDDLLLRERALRD